MFSLQSHSSQDKKCYFDINKIQTDTFQNFVKTISNVHSDRNCFKYFEGQWKQSTFINFHDHIKKIARFFVSKNLQNKKIAILSDSRPEMIEIMLAAFCANVSTTPIDVKLSPEEVAFILNDLEPEVVFVTKEKYELLSLAQMHLMQSMNIIAINDIEGFYSLKDIPENSHLELPQEDINKTGMIIYTSGSTGMMKGVETSGSQLLYQAHTIARTGFAKYEHERNLSMLPMNHLFEISSMLGCLSVGYSICIAHSLEKADLGMCLQYQKPTQIFTVPLFCKSIMNGIKLSVKDSSLTKRILFNFLLFIASSIKSQEIRQKIFSAVHIKFGGSLKRMIVGGAAADMAIIEFFKTIGINIYEGYGLTETAPVLAVNTPTEYAAGSVGKPLPGLEIKIQAPKGMSEGEIYTRGPQVMNGYYKNLKATTEVLDNEGWFKTGDIGYISPEGFLYITGRSKNLIILENGKKIHPEEVEKIFDDINFIQEISIFGDKSKQTSNSENIVLVAYLNPEFYAENGHNESLTLLINEVHHRANRIASYKMPTKIFISKEELPKTTTMKVKHFIVASMYEKGEFS